MFFFTKAMIFVFNIFNKLYIRQAEHTEITVSEFWHRLEYLYTFMFISPNYIVFTSLHGSQAGHTQKSPTTTTLSCLAPFSANWKWMCGWLCSFPFCTYKNSWHIPNIYWTAAVSTKNIVKLLQLYNRIWYMHVYSSIRKWANCLFQS